MPGSPLICLHQRITSAIGWCWQRKSRKLIRISWTEWLPDGWKRPEILKFKLNFKIGFEDVFLTTYAVPFISTLISFVLKLTTKNVNLQNKKREYYYKIEPIYNENIINLRLNCIINVKIVHIINIIYIFLIKKGRSDKYERTSYRRSYGYGHE